MSDDAGLWDIHTFAECNEAWLRVREKPWEYGKRLELLIDLSREIGLVLCDEECCTIAQVITYMTVIKDDCANQGDYETRHTLISGTFADLAGRRRDALSWIMERPIERCATAINGSDASDSEFQEVSAEVAAEVVERYGLWTNKEVSCAIERAIADAELESGQADVGSEGAWERSGARKRFKRRIARIAIGLYEYLSVDTRKAAAEIIKAK